MSTSSLILLVLSTFLAATGQIFLKIGANGRESIVDFFNLWLMSGLTLYVLGAAAWIFVLSKVDVSTVTVFTALTFVLVIFGGVVFLGEQLDRSAIFGSIVVVLGLIIVTFKPI